jgi:hypothetical protein
MKRRPAPPEIPDRLVKPDDEAVKAQMYKAREHGLEGVGWVTRWPGTTYEQGVYDALCWALGQSPEKPVE